ncbi:MAG: hypothetical protein JWR22_4274 [Herminiimonas sp.]|nr:hypothetical protein [Herminiimonas sp.]
MLRSLLVAGVPLAIGSDVRSIAGRCAVLKTSVVGLNRGSAYVERQEKAKRRSIPGLAATPCLQCGKDALDRIVGKYSFSEKEKLQCGLNGCNTWHWNGYVIQTKEGDETHCGQDCGNREFGVSFKEVEAVYKAAVDRKTKKDHLEQVAKDRDALLVQARELYSLIFAAGNHIDRIVGEIKRDPELDRAFTYCLRSGGRILVEDEESKRLRSAMDAGTGKADLKSIGMIRGTSVVFGAARLAGELKCQVIAPLHQLTVDNLDFLSIKDLTKKAATFGNLGQVLSRAGQVLSDYDQFKSLENLEALQLLPHAIPKRARTGRVVRILERLRQHYEVEPVDP